jgi:hypothetical protein
MRKYPGGASLPIRKAREGSVASMGRLLALFINMRQRRLYPPAGYWQCPGGTLQGAEQGAGGVADEGQPDKDYFRRD